MMLTCWRVLMMLTCWRLLMMLACWRIFASVGVIVGISMCIDSWVSLWCSLFHFRSRVSGSTLLLKTFNDSYIHMRRLNDPYIHTAALRSCRWHERANVRDIHVLVCPYLSVCLSVFVCVSVCLYVCLSVCRLGSIYCMYICIYVHVCRTWSAGAADARHVTWLSGTSRRGLSRCELPAREPDCPICYV